MREYDGETAKERERDGDPRREEDSFSHGIAKKPAKGINRAA